MIGVCVNVKNNGFKDLVALFLPTQHIILNGCLTLVDLTQIITIGNNNIMKLASISKQLFWRVLHGVLTINRGIILYTCPYSYFNDKCHNMREFSLDNLIVYIIYNNYDEI